MTSFALPGTHIAVTPFYDKARPLYSLVNFSQHPVIIDGVNYPTTEHFFQAQKFAAPDPTNDKRQAFLQAVKVRGNGPADALTVAREWTKNWNDAQKKQWYAQNEQVMEKALRAKCEQHPSIATELLSTTNSCLVEDTGERNETIWGWGNDGSGTNKLGKLWMKLRNELFSAEGKADLMVDPDKLYSQVQKARLALGKRNTLMQTWPDVKSIQSTPAKSAEKDTVFLLAADVLKQMQKGQSAQTLSRKGEKLVYGVSGQFGSFYIKGMDRNGSPIDVYIKNNQLFENNRQVAKSTWAEWALPIIRQSIKTPLSTKPVPPPIPSTMPVHTSSKTVTALVLLGTAVAIVAGALAWEFTLPVSLLMGMATTAGVLGFIQCSSTTANITLHRSVIEDSTPVNLPQQTKLLYQASQKPVVTSAEKETAERKTKLSLSR